MMHLEALIERNRKATMTDDVREDLTDAAYIEALEEIVIVALARIMALEDTLSRVETAFETIAEAIEGIND